MEKVYLQKQIFSGTSVSKGTLHETVADFSIYISDVPFLPIGAEMKDPASRDWHDEDGLDVFYTASPPMKDYDLELSCMAKGTTIAALRSSVDSFLQYLSGSDGLGSVFLLYDTRSATGRQHVRYVSASTDVFYNEDSDTELFLSFKVKFHVDDPRTLVSPVYSVSSPATVTGLSIESTTTTTTPEPTS